jgi:hypothetical protein
VAESPESWRRVVIPHEHGGWAFLAEPLVLGNLVAFSGSGLLIAVAATAAFLARQPLVLWVSDRRRGRRYPRTVVAERAFTVLMMAAAAALAGAVVLARGPLLFAVTRAAPLAAAALAFDLSRRSRALAAELMGSLALAGSAAAIALAGGWEVAPALGLWGVLAARGVSSIAYVRARLRLERGEPAPIALALTAQALAVAGIAALAQAGPAPRLAVAALVLLALRAAVGLSPWRVRMTTMQLGISEIVFGALTIAATAVGLLWG